MDTIIFGNYTLGQLVYAAGGVIVVVIFIMLIMKIFSKKEPSVHMQNVICRSCGWKGQVSRYAGRCPKCSEPLGDLKSKKMQ
jgi:predicted Zn-ribbon and HTH transcriptional regulator